MKNEKIKVEKTIFHKTKDTPFTWKELKEIQFEDDDEINVSYVEPYYSENNSWDGHFMAEVTRMVLETDEQFEERIKRNEAHLKELKERRYENYLRLKKEFEGDDTKKDLVD